MYKMKRSKSFYVTNNNNKKEEEGKNESKKMKFVDSNDDYIYEEHVVGRLPLKEPEDVDIVFEHNDKLWQDDDKPMTFDADVSDSDDDTPPPPIKPVKK